MQFLGILANFSNVIECYFARNLGKGIAFVHTPTKCSFGSRLLNCFSTVQRARISPTSREAGNVTIDLQLYISMWHGDASSGLALAV